MFCIDTINTAGTERRNLLELLGFYHLFLMFLLRQAGFVEGDFELRHVLFYGGCGFTIMRCMSFALENCERKDGNYNILELLKYNFYLPYFYFGPIMTFDKFYVQVSKIKSRRVLVILLHSNLPNK